MGQPVINGAIYYHNGIPYTYQVFSTILKNENINFTNHPWSKSNNRNGYQKYYGDGNPGASGEMVTLMPALIRLSKQLGRTFRYQSYY